MQEIPLTDFGFNSKSGKNKMWCQKDPEIKIKNCHNFMQDLFLKVRNGEFLVTQKRLKYSMFIKYHLRYDLIVNHDFFSGNKD